MEAKRLLVTSSTVAVLSLLLCYLLPQASSYTEIAIDELQTVERLTLASVAGPESLAFDSSGGGPYTGVSGGQILKWQGNGLGWTQFATNSKTRGRECDTDGGNLMNERICGRPLGVQFHGASGILYVADAYFGLLAVGPRGGAARQLAASAEGGPFVFTNGLDVDQNTGVVYFTDSSTRFHRADYLLAVLTGDSTGRLMKYDPATKKVTVMRHGLPFPNGVALSDDGSFLLMAETGLCRVSRYWLRGHKAGALELFAELPGYPDNIKRTPKGEFWVAINREKIDLNGDSGSMESEKVAPATPAATSAKHAVALRLSREGEVLGVLNGGIMASVSEVVEKNGTIWVGSVDVSYVGVYRL